MADEISQSFLDLPEQDVSIGADWLTLWGRMTHICIGKLTIIGSDTGLSPGRRQAIIWTNAGIFYWTLRNKLQWNSNRNSSIFIEENIFENVVCEMLSISSRSRCVNSLGYVGTYQFVDWTTDFIYLHQIQWFSKWYHIWNQGWSTCLIFKINPLHLSHNIPQEIIIKKWGHIIM